MAITNATKTPVTENPLETLRKAYIEGKDPEAAVYGTSSGETAPSSLPEVEPTDFSTEEVVETPEISVAPSETPDSEVVWVKDAKGRKQKLEISYADREKIKKAYLQMAGMRKFQLERDEALKTRAELEAKHQALSSDFGKLENVYKEQGVRGLYELLGGSGAWDKAVETELKQREYMAGLSPTERANHAMAEKEKSFQATQTALEKKYQQALEEIQRTNDSAIERSLESRLVPSFEKYRFKGKLGNDLGEDKIDKAIWTEVVNNLSEYPDNVELTQSLIDKEFREASLVYKGLLRDQAEKTVKTAVARKKEDAAQRVQVQVKKGIAANSMDQELKEDIANSRWSDIFQKIGSGRFKSV